MTISPATITVAPDPAVREPRALGLDLSLTSTGVASSLGWCTRIRPGGPGSPNRNMCGVERLRYIVGKVKALAVDYDLAVIEGPSYGSKGGKEHERGGLWWMVRDIVDRAGIPVAVVPPTTLKLYATGSGKAKKTDMITAAVTRYPLADVRTDDEADALHLADMGAAWLDVRLGLSDTQVRAMRGVPWPASEVTVR